MSLGGEIDVLLGIIPVPGLSAAFTVFKFILSTVQAVQASKEQLKTLAEALGQLLGTLDGEFKSSTLIEASCVKSLNDLQSLLQEVHRFVEAEKDRSFLKSVFHAESRVASIEMFYHRIDATAKAFEILAMLNIQHLLHENERARSRDADMLNSRFRELENNQSDLKYTLEINQNNATAMMVSIERRIEHMEGSQESRSSSRPDQKFYSHTLRYLSSTTGQQVELENWMISPFDVDYGPQISSGGFGTVFKGTWNRTPVAIKNLRNAANVRASTDLLRNEIKIWNTLRHPNILQFLGANTLDNEPFLVMQLMPHTAPDFLRMTPAFNPLSILLHVSLGLEYLHSGKICHGDLRGINIMVDSKGHALLCDFGLTRIKADITSRTNTAVDITLSESRNWMAPELQSGSAPRIQSDIYSFGMTLYELYTDRIPMSMVSDGDFFEVVVKLGQRPEKPKAEVYPWMTDGIWRLAERSWDKTPKSRPTARQIHDTIEILMLA
ncbi:kinase-like domain-containing protein [Mycena galopus ATCC 62051]|nr:kinase-like domain-containing protein [Mycena galopus ATCC 62051]